MDSFGTIDQRSSWEDKIAATNEHLAFMPAPVRAIRFFRAAKLHRRPPSDLTAASTGSDEGESPVTRRRSR